MRKNNQIKFIPFNAINEFMRNDFRLHVIRSALLALPDLDRKFSSKLDRLTRKLVKVPGFRNSSKAPASMKAVAMVKAFEKHPDIVAEIINVWAESKPELRSEINQFLSNRSWKILPIEADRTKLPGFLTTWPEEDDYETLYQAYSQENPDSDASIDETSLMIIWQACRLPIDKTSMSELNEIDPFQDGDLPIS
jgi:hypothetical protein